MMDHLFTELTKRNAIRRAFGLPLLDLRAELAHDIALIETLAEVSGHPDFAATRDLTIADLTAQEGPAFVRTGLGRYTLLLEIRRQLES